MIINSGTDCHIFEVHADGTCKELTTKVPFVTFDPGPKGFIAGWFWGNDEVMLAEAEIHSDMGEQLGRRIYAFHLEKAVLRRLDISALNLGREYGFKIKSIGADSQHLILDFMDKEVAVNVDFRPESVLAGQKTGPASKGTKPAAGVFPVRKRADVSGETPTSYWALWLALAAIVALVIYVWLSAWRRKNKSKRH